MSKGARGQSGNLWSGKGREWALTERVRREIGAWPKGPAGGFEPIGEIAKRLAKKLAAANGSSYNVAAPGGVDAPAEGLTDDAAR